MQKELSQCKYTYIQGGGIVQKLALTTFNRQWKYDLGKKRMSPPTPFEFEVWESMHIYM